MTREQYKTLREDPEMHEALTELRRGSLILALSPYDETSGPVYWLAPWYHDVIGPALVFTGNETPSASEQEFVNRLFDEVGYAKG
jgi:hypothetical protein